MGSISITGVSFEAELNAPMEILIEIFPKLRKMRKRIMLFDSDKNGQRSRGGGGWSVKTMFMYFACADTTKQMC